MTWFANIKMLLCRFIDKMDQRAAGNRLSAANRCVFVDGNPVNVVN
jgi:hypothetical protein